MHSTVFVLAALLAAAPVHSIDFWRSIAKNGYEPPAGSDVAALTAELGEALGSPDPDLRDRIGYSTLAVWIYQKKLLGPDETRALSHTLMANLERGVGERDTDGVLRRSFSALVLSVVIARDNAAPFLDEKEVRQIEDAAIRYLDAERDLRGYDPVKGWMHSAAHTADLLKFLGRSRFLDADGQGRILDAIGRKLAGASVVFAYGEDERLARAALSLVNRTDFNRQRFASWIVGIRPPSSFGERPTEEELRARQNVKNFLAKLDVLLSIAAEPSDGARAAHDSVRGALKDLF